jgi:hypothetical protein
VYILRDSNLSPHDYYSKKSFGEIYVTKRVVPHLEPGYKYLAHLGINPLDEQGIIDNMTSLEDICNPHSDK